MLATIHAPALLSLDGYLIDIECDQANGLPGFVVVGLGDQAISEARERVRSAIRNSGLILPPKRLTLNLAPADLPKDGTGYDLGMAVAILVASGQIEASATANRESVHSRLSSPLKRYASRRAATEDGPRHIQCHPTKSKLFLHRFQTVFGYWDSALG